MTVEKVEIYLKKIWFNSKNTCILRAGAVLGHQLKRDKTGKLMFTRGKQCARSKERCKQTRIILNLLQISGTLSHCWMASGSMQLCKKEGKRISLECDVDDGTIAMIQEKQ